MKVHLNLQAAPNRTSGIGVYTHEIATRLAAHPELELTGGFNSLRTGTVSLFDDYRFPVHRSRIPERIVYSSVRRPIPLTYNTMMADRSEAFVFFANRIPALRVVGKVTAVIHDLIPLKILLERPRETDRFHHQLDEIHQRADFIVTVSEWSRADIATELGIDPERIVVVPNGIELASFNHAAGSAHKACVRARYSLPEKYILYFGGTRPYKNVAHIIDSYSLLSQRTRRHVKLVITRQDAHLKAHASDLGISDFVVFTDPIRDEDKAAVYQMADMKVLMSLYEGFGIPAIEAMAAGTPVIASNSSSLPEVCGAAAILLNPLDTEALSENMERVLNDFDLRQSMTTLGVENARRFSWDASAAAFYDLLVRS